MSTDPRDLTREQAAEYLASADPEKHRLLADHLDALRDDLRNGGGVENPQDLMTAVRAMFHPTRSRLLGIDKHHDLIMGLLGTAKSFYHHDSGTHIFYIEMLRHWNVKGVGEFPDEAFSEMKTTLEDAVLAASDDDRRKWAADIQRSA